MRVDYEKASYLQYQWFWSCHSFIATSKEQVNYNQMIHCNITLTIVCTNLNCTNTILQFQLLFSTGSWAPAIELSVNNRCWEATSKKARQFWMTVRSNYTARELLELDWGWLGASIYLLYVHMISHPKHGIFWGEWLQVHRSSVTGTPERTSFGRGKWLTHFESMLDLKFELERTSVIYMFTWCLCFM